MTIRSKENAWLLVNMIISIYLMCLTMVSTLLFVQLVQKTVWNVLNESMVQLVFDAEVAFWVINLIVFPLVPPALIIN